MKYIIPVIAAFALLACKTADIQKYEYKSTTMLGTRTLTITKDSVVTDFNGRAQSTHQARATTPEEWEKLKKSVDEVKLKEINDLESPSNMRQTDASPYAMIMLSTEDSTYQSASFDGYNAPEMLQPLTDIIKEIAQSQR